MLAALLGPTPLLGQMAELSDGPITLERAIRFALDRNPRLAGARYAADAAGAEHAFRSLSRLPKWILAGQFRHFPLENKLSIDGHMDLPPSLEATRRQFQTTIYDVRSVVSFPVYTGGRLSAEISAADHMAEAAEASARATRDDVIFGVAAPYFAVLRLQKVVEATEAAVRTLEESARIVEQRVDVGKAPVVDLYRIRTRLANTRQELIRRTGDLAKAKTRLREAMGVEDVLQRIDVADTLAYTPRQYDLSAAVEQALRRRPEYLAQSEMVKARGRMVTAAIAGYLPQVSFNGYLSSAYGASWNRWRSDAGIVVNISLGFLDPVNPAAVREAKAAQRAEEQRLQGLRLEVVRQVETAYLDVGEAEKRIRAAEAALQEARETVRIEQLKLEVGKGIINDLLDAEADLLQAEVNYATALADHNVAVFALERGIGGIDYEALVGAR